MSALFHRIIPRLSRMLLVPLLVAGMASSVSAATFTVLIAADEGDSNPGNGQCDTSAGFGFCTIRSALEEAVALPGSHTIFIPQGSFVVSSTLNVTVAGGKTITVNGTLGGTNGTLIRPASTATTVLFAQGPGTLELNDLTLADGRRGLLMSNSAQVVGDGLILEGHSATSFGGGIRVSSGFASLTNCAIIDNTAPNGGGAYVVGGSLILTNCTISGNTATNTGFDDGGGGVLLATSQIADLELHSCTVADNYAGGRGGGVMRSETQASTNALRLRNTIVADNLNFGGTAPDCAGTIISQGGNLVGNDLGCPNFQDTTGDILDGDADLGVLGDNGGPTPTHLIGINSEAIDNAVAGAPTTDQRGEPRGDGDADGTVTADSGAYEFIQTTVTEFGASPTTIANGLSAALTWSVANASSCSINGGVGAVDAAGTTTVSPTATTTYVLSCTGPNGDTDTALRTVTVVAPPNIVSFTASPDSILESSAAELAWNVSGDASISCSIAPGVGAVGLSGTQIVNPSATTTYTLTCSIAGASDEASTTLEVIPFAEVQTFTASPATIDWGDATTLTWSSVGTSLCVIDNGVGTVGASDTEVVSPIEDTTYTITCTGPGGQDVATTSVTVNPPVAVTAFSAAPGTIDLGASSTLTFAADNATSCAIDNGVGAVSADGTTAVSPSVTTTYTYTCQGVAGPSSSSATVTVLQPVAIDSFTATPSTILNGNSTTLAWSSSESMACSISPGVGSVGVSGSAVVSPTATTTYTLDCTGPGVDAQSTVTVTVEDPVVIGGFSASPATIDLGASSTLTIASSFATSCTVDNGVGSVSANGTVTVSPTDDTAYTLTCQGPGGPVSASTSVTVLPPVAIDSFTASPSTILNGDSTTLSWSSTESTACTISPTAGAVATSGTVSVSPTATTTYTLNCSGPGIDAQATVTVTVEDPVAITAFSASPGTIDLGGDATLTFASSFATSCSIDQGIGPVSGNGTIGVSPTADTTYTLTCEGPGGPVTAAAGVTVLPPVSIDSFTAAPDTIVDGDAATLSWASSASTGCTISPSVGPVATSGSVAVSPSVDTTYTLDCTGPGMDAQSTISVTVQAPVTIALFSASPDTIDAGASSTLSISASNATSCSIDNGVGTVAAAGTVLVSPQADSTYTLTCQGPGGPATATATVTVLPPVAIDSFTATPETILDGASSTLTWAASDATACSLSPGIGAVGTSGTTIVTPTVTTTYTLDCSGPGLSAQSTVTVTVEGTVAITAFSASPDTVLDGGSSNLSFATDNATACTLDNGIGTVGASGTIAVTPAATTTYTLNCEGPGGPVTSSVTVTVELPVAIDDFYADPNLAGPSAPATLHWASTNATSCTIAPDVGDVAATDSVNVSPLVDTTYTLSCEGAGGPVTATIDVTAAVVIEAFSVDPIVIDGGQSASLDWTVNNATSCSIDPDLGAIATSGTQAVSPGSSTVYTLTCEGPGGPVTETAALIVNGSVGISNFEASASPILEGGSTTLSWSTSEADSCTLDGASVAVNGTQTVTPAGTTSYTLECDGSGGPVSATVTVEVQVPVTIDSFDSDVASISTGESATLSWTTSEASSCTLTPNVGPVAVNDSEVVSPMETTDYTLVCEGPGGPVSASVTVAVGSVDPDAEPDAAPDEAPDAGAEPDADADDVDAGPEPDAGTADADGGGTEPDASWDDVDAGSNAPDAGGDDASTPTPDASDAGTSEPDVEDAGTTVPDAGPEDASPTEPDAGSEDAATTEPDAGAEDASTQPDVKEDDASSGAEVTGGGDAGTSSDVDVVTDPGTSGDDAGCSGATPPSTAWLLALMLLLLALGRRRWTHR